MEIERQEHLHTHNNNKKVKRNVQMSTRNEAEAGTCVSQHGDRHREMRTCQHRKFRNREEHCYVDTEGEKCLRINAERKGQKYVTTHLKKVHGPRVGFREGWS